MKLADSVMAGKTSEGSIKWQLCYDISARTWWMVSWHNIFFFFSFLFLLLPPFFFNQKEEHSLLLFLFFLLLLLVAFSETCSSFVFYFPPKKAPGFVTRSDCLLFLSVSVPSSPPPRCASPLLSRPVSGLVPAQVCSRDRGFVVILFHLINRKLLQRKRAALFRSQRKSSRSDPEL